VLSLRPPSRPSLPCSRALRTRHACPPPTPLRHCADGPRRILQFVSGPPGPAHNASTPVVTARARGGGRGCSGPRRCGKVFSLCRVWREQRGGEVGWGLGVWGGRGKARWRSLLGWGERSTLRGNAAQCAQALADLERLCSALPRHGGAWVGHGECVVCMAAPRCAPLRPCCHARCADRARRTWCGAVSRRAARRWSGAKRGPSD
jgi:hypothetical protein